MIGKSSAGRLWRGLRAASGSGADVQFGRVRACGSGRVVTGRLDCAQVQVVVGPARLRLYAAGVRAEAGRPNTLLWVPVRVKAQPRYSSGWTPIARQVATTPRSVAARWAPSVLPAKSEFRRILATC